MFAYTYQSPPVATASIIARYCIGTRPRAQCAHNEWLCRRRTGKKVRSFCKPELAHVAEPVMVGRDLSGLDHPGGRARPLTSGRIQLQSEGAETYLRNITIEPIDHLPTVAIAKGP